MLSLEQAIILGMVQGITELFPISSLGHSTILPRLLGWHIRQNDPFFLIFLVATHAATAIVLFIYFWKDWRQIISGLIRSFAQREIKESDTYAKLGWLLILATIPAGVFGLLFEDFFKKLFASPQLVAFVLILNGLLLFLAEILRRNKKVQTEKGSDQRIAKIKWIDTLRIGVLQAIALIPGFSRTGAAITGGLAVGLSHEDAARFSFLLATPIIGAAAFLKLPELATQTGKSVIIPSLVGAIFAGIFAYISVKFLTKYFETETLTPFASYCVILGASAFLLFLFL